MRIFKRSLFNSLTIKLFLSVFLIIGPLILIQIFNNYYSIQVIKNQVEQSNENLLKIYTNQIDQDLEGIENYLFQFSWKNTDLNYLQYNETMEQNDYELAKIRLFNSINEQSNLYNVFDSIFIYSTAYKDFIHTQKANITFQDRMTASNEILHLLENQRVDHMAMGWNIYKENDNYYLIHFRKFDGVYVGAWLNMNRLIQPFKYIDIGKTGRVLLADSNLEPITNKHFVEDRKIELNTEKKYGLSGEGDRFFVLKEKSSKADFYLVAIVPAKEILYELPFLQRISTTIAIVAVVFLSFFIFVMRRIFLRPIIRIVRAMKELRRGNLDVRIPEERTSTEFEIVDDTFNHMVLEIKDLKINVYEEKLNLKQAELRHLQLQINPHFFLNSLNIIYNLATVKDFALIQEMTRNLVNYFRFMFRSESYFVSLGEELQHTKNYLRIQELRFPDTFNYYIDSQKDLLNCKIPPLVVQTITENSIKHAMDMDEPIGIYISVRGDESNSEYLILKVWDTGIGFSEDILADLQNKRSIDNQDGEQIGLWNMTRRLELLYEHDVKIEFSNNNRKGAMVTIHMPIVYI